TEQRSSFLGQLVERTKALPGVWSVSSADSLPFAGSAWRRVFAAETASKGHKELISYAVFCLKKKNASRQTSTTSSRSTPPCLSRKGSARSRRRSWKRCCW